MPLKIKYFLWLCRKKRSNSRDILGKKIGNNAGGGVLCHHAEESVDRLFSTFPFFSTFWKRICCSLGVLHRQSSFEYLFMDWRFRNFPKAFQPIIPMLFLAMIWACWKERCIDVPQQSSITSIAYAGLQFFYEWSILSNQKLLLVFGKIRG